VLGRTGAAPGAIPSPNIWHHPSTYELENRAADPERAIESAMRAVLGPQGWAGRSLLDLGCGTGFHLPQWASGPDAAARVIGVEPHPDLLAVAARRTRRLGNVTLLSGTAQSIPLPDASVDVVQARWAYFFGPGCEPGLAELDRVVRRGGTAFVIDNDARRSIFGSWFRRGYPMVDPDAVERFWSTHGWTRTPVDIAWRFDSRADLEAVVRIEFTREVADRVLAEWPVDRTEDVSGGDVGGAGAIGGLEVDYAVNLWHRTF
jgi:ubiquinone/menaquinone biosynthesis C-methylase UbiE